MKLDKIRFARLISYLSRNAGGDLCVDEIERIDDIIDFEMPNVSTDKVDPSRVDELLKQIVLTNKIEAIKSYRALTGAGLRESKDAVEKYWLRQPAPDKLGPKTMLDCIDTNINAPTEYFLLKNFNQQELLTIRSFIESFIN